MFDGMSSLKIVVPRHHNIIKQGVYIHVGSENITIKCVANVDLDYG